MDGGEPVKFRYESVAALCLCHWRPTKSLLARRWRQRRRWRQYVEEGSPAKKSQTIEVRSPAKKIEVDVFVREPVEASRASLRTDELSPNASLCVGISCSSAPLTFRLDVITRAHLDGVIRYRGMRHCLSLLQANFVFNLL